MIQLSQPIFLWALTGLTIPLAIHLLSRKEGKVIRMGSLRHLRETSTQQFRGIKLNEIVLLALRSLLIGLFVLLLCGLHWIDQDKKRWLVVEKGVEKNAMANKLADSLKLQGYEWHWLQKGFPLEKEILQNNSINSWHLISLLGQKKMNRAVVLSYSRAEDFKGLRQAMGTNVQWITFPSEPTDFIAEAIQQSPDHILIRGGHSQADRTTFETTLANTPPADSIKLKPMPSKTVVLVSDPGFENDQRLVKAALDAITKTLPITFKIQQETPEKAAELPADWLIWLSNQKIPVTNASKDTVKVIVYHFKPSNQLLDRMAENHWALNKRLTLETARQENLTLQLASLMMDEKDNWQKVACYDRRVLPDSILFQGMKTQSRQLAAKALPPINTTILLLLLFTLVIERMVAYRRNQ
jgi:hypothetical protein